MTVSRMEQLSSERRPNEIFKEVSTNSGTLSKDRLSMVLVSEEGREGSSDIETES